MEQDVVTGLIAQIGISGLFVYLFWRIYTDSNKKIEEKDTYIKELNQKVLDAFQKNTESNVNLKVSIDQNTKATETLSQRVYDVIKSNNGHNGSN